MKRFVLMMAVLVLVGGCVPYYYSAPYYYDSSYYVSPYYYGPYYRPPAVYVDPGWRWRYPSYYRGYGYGYGGYRHRGYPPGRGGWRR